MPRTPRLWQRDFFLLNCSVLRQLLASERSGVVNTFRYPPKRRAMNRIIFLLLFFSLGGCNSDSSDTTTAGTGGTATKNNTLEVWTVSSDGDFINGEELLLMSHGEIEGTGEHWAADTYGLKISNGKKSVYLLWDNSPVNPFGLAQGDRFQFADTINDRFFSEELNGYHADKTDIVKQP